MADKSVMEMQSHSTNYLKRITCYDILPLNGKLIYLDTTMLVRKALYVLLQNGIRSVPLWDHEKKEIVGIVTATDFLQLILYFYENCDSYSQVEQEMEILTIKAMRDKKLISFRDTIRIHPQAAIYEAANLLVDNHVHRVFLMDKELNDALVSVMTPYRILNFIAVNFKGLPMFRRSIKELGLGTTENLVTISAETPIIDALRLFLDKGLSALPIVNENGILLDVYEKYDMIVLSKGEQGPSLDNPMREALLSRSEIFEGVHTCRLSDTLESIMIVLKKATVHRFMIVSEINELQGVLSLSDILKFLIFNK